MATPHFSDIRGNKRVKDGILQALAKGHIHHAFLFSGRAGIGKKDAAMELARLLMCEHSKHAEGLEALSACRECRHCRRIDTEQHPDFVHITPSGRFILIDQIRALQKQVSYRPFEAKFRVVLIEPAQSMRHEAANALLKTLEEPLDGTVFILLTEQLDKLLPTIISRCQPLRWAPTPVEEVEQHLINKGFPPYRARLLSVMSEGSIERGVALGNDDSLDARIELVQRISELPFKGVGAAMSIATAISTPKEEISDKLLLLRTYFRDMMILRTGADSKRVAFSWNIRVLKGMSDAHSMEYISRASDAIDEAESAISRNVNPLIALESMLLTMASALRRRPKISRSSASGIASQERNP